MKKLVSVALAVFLLLSCASVLAIEETNQFALTEETLTAEQGPVWYYLYYDAAADAVAELNLTTMWGDNWQFSKDPEGDQVFHSICEWEGIQAMPGTWMGQAIDIIAAFRAPKAGKIVIEPMTFEIKDDGNTYTPYLVSICSVSGETVTKLFPATEEEFALTPSTTEAIELEVTEGDEIRFTVRASDDGGAAVSVMPIITYQP